MPKFSVVVPVYNVEKFLPRCIDSLVNQTLRDIEIILVDDGSPDNCPAICDQYAKKDNRIKVIHKKNGGVSAARNDGLAVASGDWIIFCDSDDWMETDGLENLYTAGESRNADVVIADVNRIVNDKSERRYLFEKEFVYSTDEEKSGLIVTLLYPKCNKNTRSTIGYGGPWNKAMRMELVKTNDLSFDTSVYGVCDDRLFNLRAYQCAVKIVYIQKPVYNYVLVEGSITQSFKSKAKEVNMAIFKAFEQNLSGFENQWGVLQAYDALVIWRLEEAVKQYFFNSKNECKLRQKLRELKDTMLAEPYKGAADRVDKTVLSKFQGTIVTGIRIKSPVFIWLMHCFRALLGRG